MRLQSVGLTVEPPLVYGWGMNLSRSGEAYAALFAATVTLADAEMVSAEIVAGWDKASLGRFAIPADVLAAWDTVERLHSLHPKGEDARYSEALGKAVRLRHRSAFEVYDVRRELLFWWRASDDIMWDESAMTKHNWNGIAQLSSVQAHPEMHDYFDADIWDIDFIRRCLDNGDDAEAAHSMLVFEKATTSDIALAEYKSVSDGFVGGLDRTRLGRFAIPLDVLTAEDTLQRIGVSEEAGLLPGVSMTSTHYKTMLNKSEGLCKASGIKNRDALNEVLFWWRECGDPLWDVDESEEMMEYHKGLPKLITVYDNPDKHDYFEAGIWDVSFIERCIAEGVDAELASSLRPVEAAEDATP